MLIKNCIYFIILAINLFSLPALVYSIKNKNESICKNIIIVDIAYMIYLFANVVVLPEVLYLDLGLEILFLAFASLIAEIIYIISIILCSRKIKKNASTNTNTDAETNTDADTVANTNLHSKSIKILLVTILLLTLPVLLFSGSFLRESYLIRNSDLILVYDSRGNGGFGDSEIFAYAVSDDYCEPITLGLDIGGYDLEKFLPKTKTVKEIDDVENIRNYDVTVDDNGILIYKNNKLIHKKQHASHYFNIDFERGFYLGHD